jgi:SAM-dependent methyltransferase
VRAGLVVATVLLLAAPAARAGGDVPFLESPQPVVEAMLRLADVQASDTLYDLGSGDGRIVISAAARYGCEAVGLELDAQLVDLSERLAEAANVAEHATFMRADFFHADISSATVVMMYLSPRVNRRLAPILLAQLAPGTRVVSHKYAIEGWRPERRIKVAGRPVYLYTIPEHVPDPLP